jgi:hypothetical protein
VNNKHLIIKIINYEKTYFNRILAVAGLTATANAQIQKGNWMVGSNLAGAISD